MTQPDLTCALWYWNDGTPTYELFASEEAAAYEAVVLTSWRKHIPVGVQFADGRAVPIGAWEAYQRAYRGNIRPEPVAAPTRTITDPFTNFELTVPEDDPTWLGKTADE